MEITYSDICFMQDRVVLNRKALAGAPHRLRAYSHIFTKTPSTARSARNNVLPYSFSSCLVIFVNIVLTI